MNRKQKKAIKLIQAMGNKEQLKTIQSMNIDGINYPVALDSMIDGVRLGGPSGLSNSYTSYSMQVTEAYKKYCGESEYGNDQVRAVTDARTAFIAGEGMSIALGKKSTKKHGELFDLFLEKNKLNGIRLMDLVRTTELSGYALTVVAPSLKKDEKKIPLFGLLQTNRGKVYYSPVSPEMFPYEITGFMRGTGDHKESFNISLEFATYIRTGGYGCYSYSPTTKIGTILTECDNYDKALKDMRSLNYTMARITPDFKTTSKGETDAMTNWLKKQKWKIGDARIGTAEFDYKTPGTGAHDNLKSEMVANLKTIAGTTGVPVHWLGWVDQMSNRATAQEMYAMVNNGTIMERTALEASLKEVLIKMQKVYIDNSGKLITQVTEDFEVKLPLIDFGKFESTIKAYSMLYADDIISEDTYRNIVPKINPAKEKELIDRQEKDSEEDLVKKSKLVEPEESEEDE